MKIGILTLPLRQNYGGILQAYVLQTYLEEQGHNVIIINREYPQPSLPFLKLLKFKLIEFYHNHTYYRYLSRFIQQYCRQSKSLYTKDNLESFARKEKLDAVIVGSDQVWRPEYCIYITNYFLDFTNKINIRRIAYAASFGVDYWQYTTNQTEECHRLAKKFDAISVRELSAVELCKRHLGISASLVLDPTMLFERSFYESLANRINNQNTSKDLFCYILDKTQNKEFLIDQISQTTGYDVFRYYPNNGKQVLLSVEKWLSCFNNAKMIITDSYHGMVFSIIFNKPFWVIGNNERGMTRFYSLLEKLGLLSRILTNDLSRDKLLLPIDWHYINIVWNNLRIESSGFLISALNSSPRN